MTLALVLMAVGLGVLLVAGDLLVRGAVALSLRLGVPALIVSLTVVAFGTSAPELIIAVQSVLRGAPGIAIGNVVGSNIANVWLVLGIPALIASIIARGGDVRRSLHVMLAVTAFFIVLAFMGPLGKPHGLLLLIVLAVVLVDTFRIARVSGARPDDEVRDEGMAPARIAALILAGVIGLPLGAEMLIRGASHVATSFGIDDAVIGLTIVAVGTSLPELATTVMAAIRRQTDVALGNVIGSNTFNLLAITGVAALVGDIAIPASFLAFDLWVMAAASATLILFVNFGIRLGKRWGIVMALVYLLYVASIVWFQTGGA